MTTPSNVLTDEDVALLRSLPSIGSTGAMADRFTRDEVRKLMADQYVIGEDYLIWRSYHADILIETLDHHTQQARADERRRVDRAAENFGSFYAAMMVSPVTLEQINGEQRVVEGATLTKALFNATTNPEGTDQ